MQAIDKINLKDHELMNMQKHNNNANTFVQK